MGWTKKKVVIKLPLGDKKVRSRAMKIAAAQGVTMVGIQGEDKDMLVVIGEGLDVATLTKVLREKVGYVTIVSVHEMKEEQAQGGFGFYNYPTTSTTGCPVDPIWPSYYPVDPIWPAYPVNDYAYEVVCDEDPPSCSIM